MSGPVEITIVIPPPGESSLLFRRTVQQRFRDAVAHAYFEDKLDAARAGECYRAVPVEDESQ